MTIYGLPLVGALQCFVILGYLTVRRRTSFATAMIQVALFAGVAGGLVGSAVWQRMPGLAAELNWIAWAVAVPAGALFADDVVGRTGPRPLKPFLAATAATLVLTVAAALAAGSCGETALCDGWWVTQAVAAMTLSFATAGWLGRRILAAMPHLTGTPHGRARIVVASLLAGILAMRGFVGLAGIASRSVAADAEQWSTILVLIALQFIGLGLIRLYPEDGSANVGRREFQVDRFRQHLAQSVVFEEGGMGPMVRGTVLTTILTVLALVGWSAVTPVNEVAVTGGEVVPSSHIRPVQHLEGGIVADVLVREGQLVDQGEVLVRLDPAQFLAELDQAKARQHALELRAERLRAFAEGRDPNFAAGGGRPASGEMARDQTTIFQAQSTARDASLAVLEQQIEQRRAEVALYSGQQSAIIQQVALLQREVHIREELAAKGLTSQVLYIAVQREAERLRGEQAKVAGQLRVAREALEEAERKVVDTRSRFNEEALDEMGTVTAELAQLVETRAQLEDRVRRLEITAPVRGLVQQLAVTSPGAVIAAGGMVTRIVPVDDVLMVESRISPRDIGHVVPGQTVRVKVASYDFVRFGTLDGTLQQVSASTFLDDEKKPYYKALITLERAFVGDDPERHRVLPGMTVQADVITGQKTVLQYLLKPMQVAAQQAFRER